MLATNVAFASQLAHSAEFYTNLVVQDYQKLLGRSPAPAELSRDVTSLQKGQTDEGFLATLAGSQEFYNHSGGNNTAWVKAAYNDILGRLPTGPELSSGVNSLAGGGNRSVISYALATGPEHETQMIVNDYGRYLNRTPSASEVGGWIARLRGGQTNENVITGFVGSAEFARLHDQADANFVVAAFKTILVRAPQPSELTRSLSFLEGSAAVLVPGSAVYNIKVTGNINGGASFTQTGLLGAVVPSYVGISDGNPEDFGIELGNPTSSTTGALYFATNRALFVVLNSNASVTPLLLSRSTVDATGGKVTLTVNPSVVNTSAFKNEFNVLSGSGNTLYQVTGGTVTLQFGSGGATFNGTISLTGKSAGSNATAVYKATVFGSLA